MSASYKKERDDDKLHRVLYLSEVAEVPLLLRVFRRKLEEFGEVQRSHRVSPGGQSCSTHSPPEIQGA